MTTWRERAVRTAWACAFGFLGAALVAFMDTYLDRRSLAACAEPESVRHILRLGLAGAVSPVVAYLKDKYRDPRRKTLPRMSTRSSDSAARLPTPTFADRRPPGA